MQSRDGASIFGKVLRRSLLVVAHAAILTCDFRIEAVLLERLVRAGARPPIGNLVDLAFDGAPHDLLAERIALLAHDVLQGLALQVRMRPEDAIPGVGPEKLESTGLEAALPLVEHLQGFR